MTNTHERLSEDDDEIQGSPDRTFGLTFAGAFLVLGGWPLLGGRPLRWWALTVAAVFLAAAVLVPGALAPLNRGWSKVGWLLHRVTNPIVTGLVFFTTITPLGLVGRALGKDPLRLRRDASASSYWIERRPPGPAPSTMTRQF